MPVASVSNLPIQPYNYLAASQRPMPVAIGSVMMRFVRGDSSSRRKVAEGF